MLMTVLIISCSSKKILSVRKIAHNGVINNVASQYDFSQKRYSALNNSKNSSAKNLAEAEASIPTVKNNLDFLASKDKVDPSVLTPNYSQKELTHFVQQEKINKSFLGEVPILEYKEITKKKSKTKDKQNKIFLILLSIVCFIGYVFMALVFAWNLLFGSFVIAAVSLLISIIFFFLGLRCMREAQKKGRRVLLRKIIRLIK
tara:strand:- start:88 stop:693 length:606 start_codon:yes stop_codon:yes gene_type:complete